MQNVLIMGSGRSGTSMVAGTLSRAGYYMGGQLWNGNEGNPKGIFEAHEVNALNETLLAPHVPHPPRFLKRWLHRDRPYRNMQKWLARIPLNTTLCASGDTLMQIAKVVDREPFCLKDPRFSYTFPIWYPFLRNTVFICVFRHPADTALSMVKECKREKYLKKLHFTFEHGLEVWRLMYEHILNHHASKGAWLFIHFNQVLSRGGVDKLAAFTGSDVDRSFPDAALQRSVTEQPIPHHLQRIYQELCERAEYNPHG